MLEKRWIAVPAQLFTANGTADGKVTVSNSTLFKVKQSVILVSNTIPSREDLEVKRITDINTIYVGPKTGNIDSRTDLSSYLVANSASIAANEQPRSKVPEQEVERLTYEEEPTVARRVILVDKLGDRIDSTKSSDGKNRLAVDGQFTAEVDVQVDVDVDGYYDPVLNPDPDNIGLIGHERSNPTDQTNQTQRITAIRGTLDTDNVSQDVALHDHNGNKYDIANPVPTTGSFEKFFQIIGDSKWMNLGVYDQVTPSFSPDGRTLTLDYLETGDLIGQAVVVFNSNIDYSITLKRYINDDGDGLLLDDDDEPLNLD